MAEVVIVPDAAAAGALVADEIVRLIRRTPTPCSDSRPDRRRCPCTRRCGRACEGVDVSRVRGFALDEYVGTRPRASGELPLRDHARGRRAARPRPAR